MPPSWSTSARSAFRRKIFEIDLTIARGLDYYTGTVYETVMTDHPEIGSVCSGGRYDNLAGYYTDRTLPRRRHLHRRDAPFLCAAGAGHALQDILTAPAEAVVIPMDTDCMAFAVETATALRAEGVKTQIYFENRKFKQKIGFADKSGIPFALIIGGDEGRRGRRIAQGHGRGHAGKAHPGGSRGEDQRRARAAPQGAGHPRISVPDSIFKKGGGDMVAKIRSLGLQGIGGYEVSAEIFLSGGLPQFDLVGLPDAAVKEARERVRASVKNCGLDFPVSRVTVNLAPADRKKAGTVYDLPILLGILIASGQARPLPPDAAVIGELSLSRARCARCAARSRWRSPRKKAGIRELYVPAGNAREAAYADHLTVYPVHTVPELLAHLAGEKKITPAEPPMPSEEELLFPRLCRGEGTGKRQARARSRRRGRAQCAHGRAAGFRANRCSPSVSPAYCRT